MTKLSVASRTMAKRPKDADLNNAQASDETTGVSAIRLDHVSKRYNAQSCALESTDLEVSEGEFFCLLGPSGCGKTTTLNLVGGFVSPTSGRIEIRGEPVDHLPPNKRNVNTVFQAYALFPHMTVEQNIGFGPKMAGLSRHEVKGRIERAIERVGLGQCAKRRPGQLSGGQQQRVAVARALVNEPAVLLLDEPLGALDRKFRKHMQFELTAIQRDIGTTFVYVTHDQEEAMAMADRIAVLDRGRVEQVGTPAEVYKTPASRFVAEFIGESNSFDVIIENQLEGKVRLPSGPLLPPVKIPDGYDVESTLIVRPDAIEIVQDGSQYAALEGRVEEVVFLGSYTRVAVLCSRLERTVVLELHGQAGIDRADTLAKGDHVRLSWGIGAATLLKRS